MNRRHTNNGNEKRARKWFKEHGFMPDPNETYHLHHIDPNLFYDDYERYNQWNIEDLVCVTAK